MKHSWTRRDFILVGVATASLAAGRTSSQPEPAPAINKRQALLGLLDADKKQEYIPAAFFLHFDEMYHRGEPAVEKHLEYFRYTGMDFVKIQYEIRFRPIPDIKTPADWANRLLSYKVLQIQPGAPLLGTARRRHSPAPCTVGHSMHASCGSMEMSRLWWSYKTPNSAIASIPSTTRSPRPIPPMQP